ncbi:MAG TPA: UvrB/UvrC motif-containing protein, partial [bacterium]|nr:UvrB/UvrC motif-containing protein [bacterium]
VETNREIRILNEWKETVLQKRPVSDLEKLEEELEEAIRLEHYEKAAKIRDKLEELQENQS